MKIPQQCFKYSTAEEQIDAEGQMVTPLEKIEWNNGIFQYLQGAAYPMKSLASAETMWALNGAKRIFIEGARFLTKWYFLPAYMLLVILPWKIKKKFLEQVIYSYCEVAWRPLSPYILKTNYMTAIAQELEWGAYSFLKNIGVKEDLCWKFAEIFASLIEYDNAYRYRANDIFAETTKKILYEKPIREVGRLLKIMGSREHYTSDGKRHEVVFNKFRLLGVVLQIGLLHPKIRKAFKTSISQIDVSKMGYDEIDKYWVCLREDYFFMGKSNEERKKIISGMSKPALIKR